MKVWTKGLTVAAALFAGSAFAAVDADEVDDKAREEIREADERTDLDERIQSRIDATEAEANRSDPMTVGIQAGLAGYTDRIGDATKVGPSWGVRLGSERWGLLGGEVAYEGSRNGIEEAEGSLYRHGVSAMAKAGLNVTENLKPFVGVGLGVSYVNRSDEAPAPYRNDFMQELPVAAGVEYRIGALTAGVRASYSYLFNDEFMEPSPSQNNPSGGLMNTSVTVGGRF